MRGNSPPGASFALDLSGLQAPGVTVWSAWRGALIAGIGALKRLTPDSAEVKSMRTHPDFLRQGVGGMVLEHIITAASAAQIHRLSLETGRGPEFEAALALYLRRGFKPGPSFSDYEENGFSQFLHLDL